MKRRNKVSAIKILMETLQKFPEGLTVHKIKEKVGKIYATGEGVVGAVISQQTKAGNLEVKTGVRCEHCGAASNVYKVTRQGIREWVL